MSRQLLTEDEITAGLAELHDGWEGTTEKLRRSIEFVDFLTAVRFIEVLAPRCEELDHHPDLDLRWRRVDIVLSTHSAEGVTGMDLQLAGVIDDVANDLPLARS